MQMKCEKCGRMLDIPDSLAGKSTKCPGCESLIMVPKPDDGGEEAGGTELTLEETTPEPMPGTAAGKRSAPVLKGKNVMGGARRAQARQQLREFQKQRAHGPSTPQAPPQSAPMLGKCSRCGADLPAASVSCPSCGLDFLPETRTKSDNMIWPKIQGVFGPAIALVLVIFGGQFLLKKSSEKPDLTQAVAPAYPVENTPAEQKPAVPEAKPYDASVFHGGKISGDVRLEDTKIPYSLSEDLIVPAGSSLTVAPGVHIEAANAIRGDGVVAFSGMPTGSVSIGCDVALETSSVRGPALEASYTTFFGPVSLTGPAKVTATGCGFTKGLTLNLKERTEPVDVKVSTCVLNPGREGGAMVLKVPASSAKMNVSITGCDIIGTINGEIGPFSAVTLTGNYWADGVGSGTAGLKGEGKKNFDNAVPKSVAKNAVPAVTVEAAPSFTIEDQDMKLTIPAGWIKGGRNSARKLVPGGSATIMMVFTPGRVTSIEDLFARERMKYSRLDKEAIGIAIVGPEMLATAGKCGEFQVELNWNNTPYHVFMHFVDLKKGTGGVVISAPKAAWDSVLPEIKEILNKAGFSLKEG